MNKSWGLDIRIDLYDKDRNMVLTLPALASVSSIKIFKLCINHTHTEKYHNVSWTCWQDWFKFIKPYISIRVRTKDILIDFRRSNFGLRQKKRCLKLALCNNS